MYANHYHLKAKPFEISPDSRFFWLSEKHAEALATLKYGILDNKGFLLITGDVGTGKTALINRLIEDLKIKVIVATIPDPGLDLVDFFKILAFEFKIKAEFRSKGEFLVLFKKFLHIAYAKHNRVVLIIDEAQRLSYELLEQIRLLSNIELIERKLINIFFVGQSEFNHILMEERNRAVRQRITLRYNIDPLTQEETNRYIRHRLKIAGEAGEIFTPDAIRAIFAYTHGNPRLINIICDHALLAGYILGIHSIDRPVIEDCERDLNISLPFYDKFAPNEKQEDILIAEEVMVYSTGSGKNSGARKMGLILSLVMAAVFAFSAHLYKYLNGRHAGRPVKIAASDAYHGFLPAKGGPFGAIADIANRHRAVQPEKNGSVNDQPNQTRDRQPAEFEKQTGSIFEMDIADEVSPVNRSGDNAAGKEQTQPVDSTGLNEKTPTVRIVRKPIEPIAPATSGPQKTEAASSASDKFSFKYPEVAGLSLEKTARPAPATKKVTLNFDRYSSELSAFDIEKLDMVARLISHYPKAKIIIEGYTDSAGNYDFNKELSEFRARVVENYFIAAGLAPENIRVIGRGSENPIAGNDTLEGRRRNRRVEIKIKDKI